MTFSLPGYNSFKRDGLQLAAEFTATINAELRVGALEESITVTGAAPVVDVTTAARAQVLDREANDSIPTGRSIQGMAQLVPGVSLSLPDTGGARAMQQTYMSTRGMTTANTTMLVDDMMVNGLQGDGAIQSYFKRRDEPGSEHPGERHLGRLHRQHGAGRRQPRARRSVHQQRAGAPHVADLEQQQAGGLLRRDREVPRPRHAEQRRSRDGLAAGFSPAYHTAALKYTSTLSNAMLFEAGYSRNLEYYTNSYQDGVEQPRFTSGWLAGASRLESDLGGRTTAATAQNTQSPERHTMQASLTYQLCHDQRAQRLVPGAQLDLAGPDARRRPDHALVTTERQRSRADEHRTAALDGHGG